MPRRISIITPVLGTKADHIGEACRSVAEQELPPDWELEWLVQQDGPNGEATSGLPAEPWIKASVSSAWGGQAIARNLALGRSTGELVKVLDADDMLCPGALWRDIAVIDEHPDVHWTVSRALNYLADDDSLSQFEYNPTPGLIDQQTFMDYWEQHGEPPIHPATLCVRRSTLLALGGWMALPTSEDTGLTLALNATHHGYFIGDPGLFHRRWEDQSSLRRDNGPDRCAAVDLMGERVGVLRTRAGWL
jgi:hypothetical protein